MSKPYWSTRHVPTLALLPDKLERGRAYFVDDEQYIVIDHGNGPVTYGGKPGPQGERGDPQPQLEDMINDLAEASLKTSENIFRIDQKRRNDISDIHSRISLQRNEIDSELQNLTDTAFDIMVNQFRADQKQRDDFDHVEGEVADKTDNLQEQINLNAFAVLEQIRVLYSKFREYDNAISILVKLVASLYPDTQSSDDTETPDDTQVTPDKDSFIETLYGKYQISDVSVDSDGALLLTITIIDDNTQARILTLNDGDTITDTDGQMWTVENYNLVNDECVMRLSYAGVKYLIETLREGDTVTLDGKDYSVSYAQHLNDDQCVIRLTEII